MLYRPCPRLWDQDPRAAALGVAEDQLLSLLATGRGVGDLQGVHGLEVVLSVLEDVHQVAAVQCLWRQALLDRLRADEARLLKQRRDFLRSPGVKQLLKE